MDKTKSLYAIYRYDFHKALQRTILAESDGIDGNRNVRHTRQERGTEVDSCGDIVIEKELRCVP